MALWGDSKLFFCILFITCCTVTLAQIPMDCCLMVVRNKEIEKSACVDYRKQISGQGCDRDAMIFLTRRGKRLCVSLDEEWIPNVTKHVDALKKHCKKVNYKGKRCTGVRPE